MTLARPLPNSLHHVAYQRVYAGIDNDDRVPVVLQPPGGDEMFHSPPDPSGQHDGLFAAHHDHLVVYEYDPEYLWDPEHYYIFDRPAASPPPPGVPPTLSDRGLPPTR